MPEESTDIPDGVKSKLNVRLMYLTEEQSHLILEMFLPTGETGEEWDGEIEKVLKWADDVMLAGNTLQMIMERKVHVKCLDFDGVIHGYESGWKGPRNIPDPPVPGAMDFIVDARAHFDINIFSSRSNYTFGRRAMKRWFRKWMVLHLEGISAYGDTVDGPPFASMGQEGTTSHDFLLHVAARTWEPWPNVIQEATYRIMKDITWPRYKPAAMVTLDDRAITFTGIWPRPIDLRDFTPWNKGKLAE